MIKYYCDGCGDKLDRDYTDARLKGTVLPSATGLKGTVALEVMAGAKSGPNGGTVVNDGQLCADCLWTAFEALWNIGVGNVPPAVQAVPPDPELERLLAEEDAIEADQRLRRLREEKGPGDGQFLRALANRMTMQVSFSLADRDRLRTIADRLLLLDNP